MVQDMIWIPDNSLEEAPVYLQGQALKGGPVLRDEAPAFAWLIRPWPFLALHSRLIKYRRALFGRCRLGFFDVGNAIARFWDLRRQSSSHDLLNMLAYTRNARMSSRMLTMMNGGSGCSSQDFGFEELTTRRMSVSRIGQMPSYFQSIVEKWSGGGASAVVVALLFHNQKLILKTFLSQFVFCSHSITVLPKILGAVPNLNFWGDRPPSLLSLRPWKPSAVELGGGLRTSDTTKQTRNRPIVNHEIPNFPNILLPSFDRVGEVPEVDRSTVAS